METRSIETVDTTSQPEFLRRLREHVAKIRPVRASRHGTPPYFVHHDLEHCQQVMLRTEGVKLPLQAPYSGPYKVLQRHTQTIEIMVNGKPTTISLNRVKPAYVFPDTPLPPLQRRRIPTMVRQEDAASGAPPPLPSSPDAAHRPPPDAIPPTRTTRSGRRVHFPARFRDTDAPLPAVGLM